MWRDERERLEIAADCSSENGDRVTGFVTKAMDKERVQSLINYEDSVPWYVYSVSGSVRVHISNIAEYSVAISWQKLKSSHIQKT